MYCKGGISGINPIRDFDIIALNYNFVAKIAWQLYPKTDTFLPNLLSPFDRK